MWFILLIACKPIPDPPLVVGGGVADVTEDTGTPDAPEPSLDELAVRGLIGGSGDVDDVLQTVAWRGGWPVHTVDDTWLFVAPGSPFIAGDFNGWQPTVMNYEADFAWAEVLASDAANIRYKLVDGDDWYGDPWARSYEYDEHGQISFASPPADRAHIERWPGFGGRGLQPRTVRVWVPPGPGPWHTLYMADGQNLFDPAAIFGGWRLPDALATLGSDILVVGVDNTADRLAEYGHTTESHPSVGAIDGKGNDYADLITLDLRPHIEQTYATDGVDGHMGSSMGGLISLNIAHRHPDEWDYVGALSPSLWFGALQDDGPVMQDLWVDAGHRDITVYVDSGGDDGGDGCTDPDGDGFPEDDPNATDGYCTTLQFAHALVDDAGYTWDSDVFHVHDVGAQHNEVYWASRVAYPLGIFASLD